MRVSIVSSTHPLVRDVALLSLQSTAPTLAVDLTPHSVILRLARGFEAANGLSPTTHEDAFTSDGASLVPPSGHARHEIHEVPLAHACMTCSVREALVPFLAHLGIPELVLALPSTVELINAVPALDQYTVPGEELSHVQLTSTVHLAELDEVARGLLSHLPLSECGLAIADDDDRCVGEVHLNNARYADMVVTIGDDPLGSDLMDHVMGAGTRRIRHLENLRAEHLFSYAHDVDEAITRIHPASARAADGPHERGVWTIDLFSERPVHPERIRERIERLVPDGVLVRGCFWIPGRADEVCALEGTSRGLTFGLAGLWPETPITHLIVTGLGEGREEIRREFESVLMSDDEMVGAFLSTDPADRLEDWLD